jgi:IS30 family transposase
MASKPYPSSSTRATSAFELIHSDLKEVTVGSYHRNHYFVTFIDDYSSHTWITLLRKKSDAHQAMLTFKATVETQYNAKIRRWRFDGGGEFLRLEDHIKKLRIEVEKSLPHEQQQNGRAERFNRTIWDKAQSLHFDACLRNSWWEFCVEHALHFYNRT